MIDKATKAVFAPNRRPDDYIERTGAYLVLRPRAFRNNAIDVANLLDYVKKIRAALQRDQRTDGHHHRRQRRCRAAGNPFAWAA